MAFRMHAITGYWGGGSCTGQALQVTAVLPALEKQSPEHPKNGFNTWMPFKQVRDLPGTDVVQQFAGLL